MEPREAVVSLTVVVAELIKNGGDTHQVSEHARSEKGLVSGPVTYVEEKREIGRSKEGDSARRGRVRARSGWKMKPHAEERLAFCGKGRSRRDRRG